MFAVIKAAGKQHVVVPGQKIKFDKRLVGKNLPAQVGESVLFDEVLLVADGDKVSIGTPTLDGVSVKGTVERVGRDRKIIVFKYKPKKRYKKKHGHRQPFSEVRIDEVVQKKISPTKKKKAPVTQK